MRLTLVFSKDIKNSKKTVKMCGNIIQVFDLLMIWDLFWRNQIAIQGTSFFCHFFLLPSFYFTLICLFYKEFKIVNNMKSELYFSLIFPSIAKVHHILSSCCNQNIHLSTHQATVHDLGCIFLLAAWLVFVQWWLAHTWYYFIVLLL